MRAWRLERRATHAIGLSLRPAADGFHSETVLLINASERREQRPHLAPLEMAAEWAVNAALIALWKALGESPSG